MDKFQTCFINDESSSRFVCSASVHSQASADGSMVTQLSVWLLNIFKDSHSGYSNLKIYSPI